MKHSDMDGDAVRLLEAQAKVWGCSLEPGQRELLRHYAELLATYDAANVIGSKDVRTIILNHVIDSLSCVAAGIELRGKLIDVGSGGGLPGIPLAIVQSGLEVTLLEATEKKVRFLQYANDVLKLSNLGVLNGRAEDAGTNSSFRDRYDLATSRALASLPVVLEYCAPFVKPGGSILAMKGPIDEDELSAGRRAATRLGTEFRRIISVDFRDDLEQKQRHIVVFRKVSSTPSGYPRRVGLAKKRPLGG